MEETNTKITVSSINEINSLNMERIITIAGDIDQISKAEAEISSRLRVAYEHDLQAMTVRKFFGESRELWFPISFLFQPQSMMFPGLHPAAMMSTVGMAPGHPQGHHPQGHHHGPGGAGGAHGHHPQHPYSQLPHMPVNGGGGGRFPPNPAGLPFQNFMSDPRAAACANCRSEQGSTGPFAANADKPAATARLSWVPLPSP